MKNKLLALLFVLCALPAYAQNIGGGLNNPGSSGGGAGVASINGATGAFTFTGSGQSCTGSTCTFSGGGSPSIGGAVTGGIAGDFLYVNPASTISQATPASASNLIEAGITIDPRDPIYGSNTCTGYYQISTSTLGSGGTGYAVNDKFTINSTIAFGLIIANPAQGHVTSVSGGVVTGYVIDNVGGGYAVTSAVGTQKVTGAGTGLTINITGIGTGNDDTVAFHNAIAVASVVGATVKVPNGCWVASLNLIAGTSGLTMDGGNFNVDYGYDYQPTPRLFIIGHPQFGINLNGASSVAFHGFEITGIMDTSAFGSTTCIGSTTGTPGYPQGKVWLDRMSMKACAWGYRPTGGFVYSVSTDSDYSANNNGLGGSISDFYSRGDTCASDNTCMNLENGNGQYSRIDNLRCEFGGTCITGSTMFETQLVNLQSDHMNGCAIKLSGWGRITSTAGGMRGSGLDGSFSVTGAANNGSGLIRIAVSGDHGTSGVSTGDKVTVANVTGTTEANGNWTVTVVDSGHLDLQASTFTNAYVSGGKAGIWGKDADVCITGTGTGLHLINVDYENGSGVGYAASPAYLIDVGASGVSNIEMVGGQGDPTSYVMGVSNWETFGPPANTHVELIGSPYFRNDTTSGSIGIAGNMGIGTNSPNASAILDLSGATSTLALPVGTTGQRPASPINGEIRYNSSGTPALEAYVNGAWGPIGGTAITWPTTGNIVLSNSTNSPAGLSESDGSCVVGAGGIWTTGSCAGTSSLTLGTSAAATNPQRSGQAGTGIYSDTSNVVQMSAGGVKVEQWSTVASGVDYLSVTPAATANPATVTLTAAGTDTNINLNFVSKGTGGVQCNGVACGGTITLGTSTSATNPQRSGEPTTGLYSAASGEIDFAVPSFGQVGKVNAYGWVAAIDFATLAGNNLNNIFSYASSKLTINYPLTVTGTVKTAGYTVATLPAGSIGMIAYVTDAIACTFLATLTGGGSTFCPVVYNGSAWVGA